jgi:RNA polymerase sigma-70 factor (ECF subfamily)
MTADITTDVETLWRDHRRRVYDVAYRLLGSVADADDVVQDVYSRLLGASIEEIDDVLGWLVTATSRLCIDRLRLHEHSRRSYVGPWLPEPVVGPENVEDRVTLDESVRMALLVVLEQLSRAEHTSFVLHEVFAVPFEHVGEILGRSPQACRQLASRARRRIAADSSASRFVVDRSEHEALVERFAAACAAGDLEALVNVLAQDVVGVFDSGGAIPNAPTDELDGAIPVARQLIGTLSGLGASFDVAEVNGDLGVIVRFDTHVAAVISLGIREGKIDLIHGVGNPAKLTRLQPAIGPGASEPA